MDHHPTVPQNEVDRHIDELIATITESEAVDASNRRMFNLAEEAVERANKKCEELEAQRWSATEVMTGVVNLSQSSLDKATEGTKLTNPQRYEALETGLKEVNANARDFLNAGGRPEGQGPQNSVRSIFKPTPSSAPSFTAPAQPVLQPPFQSRTAQAVASKLDSKPAPGSKPASTPIACQQPAPRHRTRSISNPASGSKATDTSSALRRPAEVDNPPTSKVLTTSSARVLPKPQIAQGPKPAPNPTVRPDSMSVPIPRLPASEAKQFPSLAAGPRPDLPSPRPETMTWPDIGKVNKKSAQAELDERRRFLKQQAAEGKFPVILDEWKPMLESFERFRQNYKVNQPQNSESEESGAEAGGYLEEEYSDDEDITGKRKHASDIDDERTSKRACVTVSPSQANPIALRQVSGGANEDPQPTSHLPKAKEGENSSSIDEGRGKDGQGVEEEKEENEEEQGVKEEEEEEEGEEGSGIRPFIQFMKRMNARRSQNSDNR